MPPTQNEWPTLDELLNEEEGLVLPTVTEEVAYDLGRLAADRAWTEGLPIVVGLWRGEHQLFHAALPGSTKDNDQWLRRKGRVVMHFEHSSLYMARLCRDKETTLSETFALPAARYAAAGGAIPLRVREAGVVGWMGVSGLPQLDDHRFVARILREHLDASLKG